MCRTVLWPSSSASRLSSCGAIRRSWVAQAGESAETVSSPESKDSGLLCWASCGPTMSCQWPKTAPTAAFSRQPLADSRPPTAAVSGWGSSRLGRGDHEAAEADSGETTPRSASPCGACWRGPAPGRSPLAQASALARARASAASRARSGSGRIIFHGGAEPPRHPPMGESLPHIPLAGHARDGACGAGFVPGGRGRWSAFILLACGAGHLGEGAAGDLEVGAGEDPRDVLRYRRRDQDLLGGGDEGGEAVTAAGVKFGEHVVEYQVRVLAAGPEQVEAGETKRERERPRLAVACVAAGRKGADAELELVAVRAGQADAAV